MFPLSTELPLNVTGLEKYPMYNKQFITLVVQYGAYFTLMLVFHSFGMWRIDSPYCTLTRAISISDTLRSIQGIISLTSINVQLGYLIISKYCIHNLTLSVLARILPWLPSVIAINFRSQSSTNSWDISCNDLLDKHKNRVKSDSNYTTSTN